MCRRQTSSCSANTAPAGACNYGVRRLDAVLAVTMSGCPRSGLMENGGSTPFSTPSVPDSR